MAKTYTSTITVKCIKEHACASCGNVYSYPFTRKVTGTSGRSAEAASAAARANVDKTLKRDVDQQPCPACGLIQPDMVGQLRGKRFKLVLWLLVIVPVLTLVIIKLCDGLNANVVTLALAAVAAVAALAFAAIELVNPNGNLEANRAIATQRVTDGQMTTAQTRRTGPAPLVPPGSGRSPVALLAVVIVLAAPLAAALPELVRAARHWPANADCYGPVVGPGDTTRIYMNDKINSIKSHYRGTGSATMSAPGTGDNMDVHVKMHDDDWGQTIYAKDDEKQSSSRPWVDLTVPSDPSLVGKTLSGSIYLTVEYPAISGGGSSFEVAEMKMNRPVQIRIATPGAGKQYDGLWWAGTAAAALMLLVGGFALIRVASGMRTPGTMTRVYPAG